MSSDSYNVWLPDRTKPQIIKTYSEEYAATDWAEQNGWYFDDDGDTLIVHVVKIDPVSGEETGELHKFEVMMRMNPTYSADLYIED